MSACLMVRNGSLRRAPQSRPISNRRSARSTRSRRTRSRRSRTASVIVVVRLSPVSLESCLASRQVSLFLMFMLMSFFCTVLGKQSLPRRLFQEQWPPAICNFQQCRVSPSTLVAHQPNCSAMTSLRQINYPKSAGKKNLEPHAVRHGLTAETVIAMLECLDDYEAFEAAVISDYNAETAVERQLVLRLANVLWRLRRATSIETAIFDSTIEDTRLLVCTSSLWTRRRAPDHCVSYYRGCTGRFPADSTNLPSAHFPERIFDPSAAYVAPCPFRFPFLN